MTSKAWHADRIARSAVIEVPAVEAVNLQVRTGMSVPFAPHMLPSDCPSVEPVNLQVRTGMSVPFASYMVADKKEPAKPAATAKVAKSRKNS